MLPTYDYLVVEYAGMPDVPAYMEGVRHKEKVYRANGIAAVFLYPQDLSGSTWSDTIVRRIRALSGGVYAVGHSPSRGRASGTTPGHVGSYHP